MSNTVYFASWRAVILQVLKVAANDTQDVSWGHDLEPETVTLEGGHTSTLWSPGTSSNPFRIHYETAKQEINGQIEHLKKQLGLLETAKKYEDEARAREAKELQAIAGILTDLLQATAKQAAILENREARYRECLDILAEDFWEQDQSSVNNLQQCLQQAIQTHPGNANQAQNFMSPGSMSFPTGHNELMPPGDAGLKVHQNGVPASSPLANGNAVAPVTPAATPGAQQLVGP
ncbi:hypothetical protein F5883DRAFT_527448 [Diaporthe sp. PMI_573]|nr:hypothetical protein F5883DRAFT_527448 [Diaporthaceae sp. PMI_573]